MGTGDYERRIYPEDDIEVLGDYLMYRYYPDYTKKRHEMKLSYPLPAQYRVIFDQEFAKDNSVPEQSQQQSAASEDPKKEKKGNSVTLGLWMFPSDAREPLKDVMIRLHSYVKRGEHYPDHFRYGPGRPPPPNPHLNRASQSSVQEDTDAPNVSAGGRLQQASGDTSGPSEVDKLFAKLQPQSTTPAVSNAATSRSVESWFAALAGQQELAPKNSSANPSPALTHTSAAQPAAAPASGLALLNSIFASVSQPADLGMNGAFHNAITPKRLPSQPETIQIVSPKPQSSALPQILNQDVISTLLGLAPGSRASSAAPSSNSSHRSAVNRYEGDNEFSETASDGGLSTSSTVLDEFDPLDPSPLPTFSQRITLSETDGLNHGSSSVQGDVTPRAFNKGIDPSSPMLTAQRFGHFLTAGSSVSTISSTSSTTTSSGNSASTIRSSDPTVNNVDQSANPPSHRNLVPFSPDSELWPYPRAPLNEESSDADVVELDFSDTRALSDPRIFQEKQTKQGKGEPRRKKTKKEKAADREKEREAIENGWDDPTKGEVTVGGVMSTSTSSSNSIATVDRKGKQPVNGADATAQPSGSNINDTADSARIAILSALNAHPKPPSRDLSRKQFVQEVLSLIYVCLSLCASHERLLTMTKSDNSFVDKLYQEYTSLTD
ncbi:hypothetical protein PHLCEN_2v12661 [Hermanssonia centrifuga]|uniref:Uncharacterized protein n=1 Tax=Hermanssonia centrifuga TaxID=98765 RepID=A0A2R6NG90_9APHY|nr:hypothetical protein PHLCEN_2v12661 [Hermanssonia centrifuga]